MVLFGVKADRDRHWWSCLVSGWTRTNSLNSFLLLMVSVEFLLLLHIKSPSYLSHYLDLYLRPLYSLLMFIKVLIIFILLL